jgi:Anthrone oxygenase
VTDWLCTAVEHPARLSCGVEAAVAEWAPSEKRATFMQAPLAVIAGLFGIVCGTQGGGPLWLWAAVLILAVVPFTVLAIRPTNNRLLDPRRDRRSHETLRLLKPGGAFMPSEVRLVLPRRCSSCGRPRADAAGSLGCGINHPAQHREMQNAERVSGKT